MPVKSFREENLWPSATKFSTIPMMKIDHRDEKRISSAVFVFYTNYLHIIADMATLANDKNIIFNNLKHYVYMLKYKLIERGLPNDPTAPKKFYATNVSQGKKTLNAIGKDIADISSLSRGDIQNVLLNLVDQIPKYLLDGQSVNLGEVGTMRISYSSEGVSSEAEFSTSLIKNVKIIFTPGPAIKKALESAKFEK